MTAEPTLPPGCEVRPATAADLPDLADVYLDVAGEGRWIGRELPIDRDGLISELQASVDDPAVLRLVAVRDGAVVGMLGLHLADGVAGLGMLLGPGARGQGLGSALMAEGLAWARARPDVHKVTLQHWPDNVAAHALYRKFGFVVEGYLHRQWRRANGELWDAVLMGLPIER